VFTHYLLRGLSGEASVKRDSNVRLTELSQFVIREVSSATDQLQVPVLTGPGNVPDPLIVGPDAQYSKTVVIAIGNQNYYNPQWRLLHFGETDAQSFADFWRGQGATITTRINATRADMQQVLVWAQANVDKESLALFYYSGHALSLNGTSWLVPVDANDPGRISSQAISAAEIRGLLSRSSARTQIVFIDASFSGGFGISDVRLNELRK